MGKMYLMSGLSAAGKTTFAKKFAKEHNLVYLGVDDFYEYYAEMNRIKSPWSDSHASFDVWIKYFYAIHTLEMEGKDVLIDTNAPTIVKRLQFIDWFPTFDEHNLIYIMINDVSLRIKNNKARNRIVPRDEMVRMEREFQEPITRSPYAKQKFFVRPAEMHKWDHVYVFENIDNSLHEWQMDDGDY